MKVRKAKKANKARKAIKMEKASTRKAGEWEETLDQGGSMMSARMLKQGKPPTARGFAIPRSTPKPLPMDTTWRGKRPSDIETLSRVYSQRWETKAGVSPSVAYVPYTTEQPISGESTAIAQMQYSPSKQLLFITFWKYKMRGLGHTYVFYGVPGEVWIQLNEASSKGRFFYYMIRSQYRYARVK